MVQVKNFAAQKSPLLQCFQAFLSMRQTEHKQSYGQKSAPGT
jgi:hypothetical protein